MLDVSIVIPLRNEADSIGFLLTALSNQSMKPKEIIIVDSGSTDETLACVSAHTSKLNLLGINLRIYFNPGGLPGANRNVGVKNAKYNWIAFIDAGIVPALDWLECLWDCMLETKSVAVFGVCEYDATSAFTKAVCAVSSGCGARHVVLPASLFHKDVFLTCGYFRPDLRAAEDTLWMARIDEVYGSRICCSQAVVFYGSFPYEYSMVARKWYVYQRHVIRAGLLGWSTCFLAVLFFLTLFLSFNFISTAVSLFVLYAVARGLVMPCLRSRHIFWWGAYRSAVLIAPLVAMLIDCSKVAALCLHVASSVKKNKLRI